jgi:hypothetical protein
MKFRAQVQLDGKTATGIRVPDEIVAALGSSKRPPVRVTIGDYTYRSSVASMGGVFMLGISAEVRQNTGVAAGDEIEVDLELDNEPREVTVPPDFSVALDGDAKRFFEGLSYSNKRRIVMSIEDAKTAETRQRRIEKAINSLSEGNVP